MPCFWNRSFNWEKVMGFIMTSFMPHCLLLSRISWEGSLAVKATIWGSSQFASLQMSTSCRVVMKPFIIGILQSIRTILKGAGSLCAVFCWLSNFATWLLTLLLPWTVTLLLDFSFLIFYFTMSRAIWPLQAWLAGTWSCILIRSFKICRLNMSSSTIKI